MAITLNEVWNDSELATSLVTQYNSLGSLIKTELTTTEATAIISILKLNLGTLLLCDTCYDTISNGKAQITKYLEINTFALVTEVRAEIFALSNDMGKEHSQIKFNPIDNDTIEDGAIATDNLSFNYAQNMLTNVDFLVKNTVAVKNFTDMVKRDVYLLIA